MKWWKLAALVVALFIGLLVLTGQDVKQKVGGSIAWPVDSIVLKRVPGGNYTLQLWAQRRPLFPAPWLVKVSEQDTSPAPPGPGPGPRQRITIHLEH